MALSARKPRSHFTHSLSAPAKACRAWGLGGCSSLGRRKAGGKPVMAGHRLPSFKCHDLWVTLQAKLDIILIIHVVTQS